MRLSRELGEEERPGSGTRSGPRLIVVRPALLDPVTDRGRVDPRDVDVLCAELAEIYPDPVDELENALAKRLGVRRHPACDLEQWRRARVQAIDALEDGAQRSKLRSRPESRTEEPQAPGEWLPETRFDSALL